MHRVGILAFLVGISVGMASVPTRDEAMAEVAAESPESSDLCITESFSELLDKSGETIEGNKKVFGLSHNGDDVKFFLYYSPRDPSRYTRLNLNEVQTITEGKFVKGAPIIFIAHGFLSSAFPPNSTIPLIKNAFLSMSIVNIVAVDWSELSTSKSPVAFLSYAEVTQNVPIVGRRIADMIELLIEHGIVSGPEKIHLIGHSLGAHVMGVAGHEIINRTGTPIDHITGLDPAGPLYEFINTKDKLDPTDAAYIDVLHTDIGMFGSSEILGTADFYANGGKGYAQAVCLNFTNSNPGTFISGISGVCSHSRAYRIYARSIRGTRPDLYACPCRVQLPTVIPTSCTMQEFNVCPSRVLYGYYAPRSAKGTYYVDTKDALDIPFVPPSLP